MKYVLVQDGTVLQIFDVDPMLPTLEGATGASDPAVLQAPNNVDFGWTLVDGRLEPRSQLPVDILGIRASLKTQVDVAAEVERLKYITPGEGQALTYQRKVEEAKRAITEEEPAPVDYPMLAASIGVDGDTVKEIASIVLAMDGGWAVIGSAIEKIRLSAKKAIDDAATVEAANAVVDAIIWPEGATA